MEKEESIQVIPSSEVIYQQDKAAIDMQISTAKAYPRNIQKAVNNAVAIATMDEDTARTCHYSVPRGGKSITGPSVHMAKIVAQCWGNMRIEAKVIDVDGTTVTSQAIAFDLENNLAIKVEVKRSIMTKTGRMNDDMIVVTGNAANSIALRNAVFSVVPKSVTDKVYNAAKGLILGDISDETKLIAKRKKVVDGLMQTYNVTEKEILSCIGKASTTHITGEDLMTLIGIGQAIKDGDTTVENAFKDKPKANAPTPQISKEEETKLIALALPEIDAAKKIEDLEGILIKYKELTNNQQFKEKVVAKRNSFKGTGQGNLL